MLYATDIDVIVSSTSVLLPEIGGVLRNLRVWSDTLACINCRLHVAHRLLQCRLCIKCGTVLRTLCCHVRQSRPAARIVVHELRAPRLPAAAPGGAEPSAHPMAAARECAPPLQLHMQHANFGARQILHIHYTLCVPSHRCLVPGADLPCTEKNLPCPDTA